MNRNSLKMKKVAEGSPLEAWHFDATGSCGVISFSSAIIIVDPLGIAPGLHINNYTANHGIWGVEDAINQFKAERAKLGLSTQR